MANSLNKAFIKAYTKVRNASPAALDQPPEFIVRIDTATIKMPEPHLFRAQTAPQPKISVPTSADPVMIGDNSRGGSVNTSGVAINANTKEFVGNEPRAVAEVANAHREMSPEYFNRPEIIESLSDQMLKDCDWQVAPIDAFIGGFSMRSTLESGSPKVTDPPTAPVQRTVPERCLESAITCDELQKTAELTDAGMTSPDFDSLSASDAQSARAPEAEPASPTDDAAKTNRVPAPRASLRESRPVMSSQGSEPIAEASSPPRATSSQTSEASAARAEQVESEEKDQLQESLPLASQSLYAVELEAPEAPALASEEVARIVQDYAKKHAKQGEIFRLDCPTYRPGTQSRGLGQFEDAATDSDDEESEILSSAGDLHSSNTKADLELLTEPSGRRRWDSTREVEEGLRQAKTRVFSPVWEVDCLQWPSVCIELIEQDEQKMIHVANNLTKACEEGLQVLAVTSPQAGEGRTTVACCLAKLAGIHGLRVAFVDGDLENPTVSYQTNLDVESDWKSALFDHVPLEEVAVHSIEDQVTLIPLVDPIGEDEISCDDSRIAFMLQQLTASFDLVIVDMGPMDSKRSLVTALGEQGIISAVVTVVDHRKSTPQRIEACLQRIRRTGISSIGLVENFSA